MSVKKRKSSLEGGAGMSGVNAGGGCWWCSIKNGQLGIMLPASLHSKLKTQNFTSIHEESIRRSDLRISILGYKYRDCFTPLADGGNIQHSTSNIQFQLGIRNREIRNTITGIVPLKTHHSKLYLHSRGVNTTK